MGSDWIRWALSSLTVGALGLGTLFACGGDAPSVGGPSVTPDGSALSKDGATIADDEAGISLLDGSARTENFSPAIQFVNGATDLGPNSPNGSVRICFAFVDARGTTNSEIPPVPDRASGSQSVAGIPIGLAAALQTTGADLSKVGVVPYVLSAERLLAKGLVKPKQGDPGASCQDILGPKDAGAGMRPGVDYWRLPTLAPGTLLTGKSFALVLQGCAGDSTAPAAKCGPGFVGGTGAGNGNLTMSVYELDLTEIGPLKLGAQFIHASAPQEQWLADNGGKARPGIIKQTNEILTLAPAPIALNAKTDLVQLDAIKVNAPSDSISLNPFLVGMTAPLSLVGEVSSGVLRLGAAFTFVALGDRDAPTTVDVGGVAVFNPRTFHYVALPNAPPREVYQP